MTLSRDIAATLQPGFVGAQVPDWVRSAGADGLVSVCLYGDNTGPGGGLAEVCRALAQAAPGLLLAVDEEGGDVTRLHYPQGSTTVGNALLGRLGSVETTLAVATAIGREVRGLGIALNLAPVVDVGSNPDNPVIGVRSFGSDPQDVARHTAAWIRGLQSTGVAACAKHFPGHGDTVVDSHHGLPTVDATVEVLRARELVPFAAAVAAGVDCVMTSHLVVPSVDPERPATFSPRILSLLREDLGFTGVIVSDALDMAGASADCGIPEAAVRALAAGVDLLCLGSATSPQRYAEVRDAVHAAVETGRLPAARVAQAAGRVRALAAGRTVAELLDVQAATGSAHGGPTAAEPTLAEVAQAFRIGGSVAGFVADPAPLAIVQVDSATHLAAGQVAWGPAALGLDLPLVDVAAGAKVAVVARGLVAGHPAYDVVDALTAAGHRTILVESGWPRREADIVTFGGAPVVARALVALLTGQVRR
mgnify:CR=1 FL=1